MNFIHNNGQNNVHIYNRKYLGGGKYHIRGILKGINVGDTLTFLNFTLTADNVLSVKDSKGVFSDPEDAKNALCEVEFSDPAFLSEESYLHLQNF